MSPDRYPFRQLRCDLARDIDAYLGFAAEYRVAELNWWRRLSALLMPSMLACLFYRISHWLYRGRWPRCATMVARLNLLLLRVSINPASCIGGGFYIAHPSTGIVFQGHAGTNFRMFAGCAVSAAPFSPFRCGEMTSAPVFGDDVVLGSKAFVVGGVRIGSGVRIGFNACVYFDVPDGAVIVSTHVRNRVVAPGAAGASSDNH